MRKIKIQPNPSSEIFWVEPNQKTKTRSPCERTLSGYINLQPLFIILYFLGLLPCSLTNEDQNSRMKLKKWFRYCVLLVLHLATILVACALAYNFTMEKGAFWLNARNFSVCFVTVISVDILRYKKNEFWMLIFRLNNIPRYLQREDRLVKNLKFYSLSVLVIIFMMVVLRSIVLSMMILKSIPLNMLMESRLLGIPVSPRSEFVAKVSQVIVSVITDCVVWGFLCLIQALYVLLVYVMAENLKLFNKSVSEMVETLRAPSSQFLQDLRIRYNRLMDIIEIMDSIFSPMVFFWYGWMIFTVCVEVTFRGLYTLTPGSIMAIGSYTVASLVMLHALVSFLTVSVSASRLGEEACSLLPVIRKMTEKQKTDLQFMHQSHMFLHQLTVPNVGLTGWNFFVINRRFMITVCSAVITYLIVVFQFIS